MKLIQESLLRELTMKEMQNLRLYGDVLDIGGGEKTRYEKELKTKNIKKLEHINIDRDKNPTYLMDLNKPKKIKKKYDNILCVHTIEHIFKFENVLDFIDNLKPNGVMYIFAPFLYRIHGDPYDYTRLTYKYYLDKITKETVSVKPLGFGAISAGYSMIEPLFQRFGLRIPGFILKKLCIFLDKTLCKLSINYAKFYGKPNYPLGYLIIIKKLDSNI